MVPVTGAIKDVVGFACFLAVIVIALVGFVLIAIAGARAGRRMTLVGAHEPIFDAVGGAAWHGARIVPLVFGKAPMPYATPLGVMRVQLFWWGVRIGPRWRHLKWGIPTWELRYSEISDVGLVRNSTTGRVGVRFHSEVLTTPVVFWTDESEEVLAQVREHHVFAIDGVVRLPFPTPAHPLPID